MPDIAIFYHVGQIGNWQEIYQEQIDRLTASGILDICKHFHIGINGTEPLPFVPENAHVEYNTNHELEADTLTSLWEFARVNPEYKTLYLHTKGVTRVNTQYYQITKEWREYLEYFCVDKWRMCIDSLESHDTCSVTLVNEAKFGNVEAGFTTIPANFYAGNFWWANASYIATLDPMYMYIDDIPWLRGKSELWIGTGNPKAKCLHKIDYNDPYTSGTFSKEKYIISLESKLKSNIAIFYHVGQIGNWQEIYHEQIDRLTASGILDICKHFHIGINGTEPLPFVPENAHVEYNTNHELEADTLTSLWEFARVNPEYKTLYLHTKGVTRVNTQYYQITKEWREYLEYFCVDKWRMCIDSLESHDTCSVLLSKESIHNPGTEYEVRWPAPHYVGNFWWANASYIATLDPMYMYTNDTYWLRGKSELWIGSANPKAACLHTMDYKNPYDFGTFSKEKYIL